MAIKRVIDLEVKSGQAKTSIADVQAYLSGTEKSAKSLREQMRQAQLEVALVTEKFGATSKQAAEAAKKAALLKDQIGDAKNLTDAFNPDAKFAALTNSLSGVAGGFAAVQGGMSLLGMQSDKTMEVLLKVQSAMALSQGLQGLGEARDSFKQLGAVAKNALSGIKAGIAATGIGVLLIALGAVVAYWDDIKGAVGGVSKEQKKLNADSQKNLDIQKKKLDTINDQDNVLRLQGKSETFILKRKIAQTLEVLAASKAQLESTRNTTDAQLKIANRNKDILQGILDFLSYPITLILKAADKVGSVLGKNFGFVESYSKLNKVNSSFFDADKIKADGDAASEALKTEIEKLENQIAGYELQKKEIGKSDSKGGGKTLDELEKAAAEKRQKEIDDAIEHEKEKERIIREVKEDEYEAELAAEDIKIEERRLKREKEAQEQIELAKRIAEAKEEIRQAELNAINGGIGLLKLIAGKNKTLQRAALLAESAMSIHGIIVNKQKADAADMAHAATLGPAGAAYLATKKVWNAVNAGIGVATTLAATAKALGQIGAGGGNASAPNTGGGGTASAPQFNVVGNSAVNQIAQTIGQRQPIQAYVVANEVSTQQALDRNIVKNASLG